MATYKKREQSILDKIKDFSFVDKEKQQERANIEKVEKATKFRKLSKEEKLNNPTTGLVDGLYSGVTEPTTMSPVSKAAAIQYGLEIPGMVKDLFEGIEIPEGHKKFIKERFGIKE